MMPEEWPIFTSPDHGDPPPALRAGADRLSTVRADFFLDERFRLTEQERAFMTAMLHRLVGDVAAEIQAAVPEDWLPANEDHEALLHRISRAKLLDIEGLVGLLLRRADEERIAAAALARASQTSRSPIQPLVSDSDGEVAAAAMTVLIARGRRRDRYGRPLIELDDVDRPSARSLVFAVAAGLRERLPAHVPPGEAENRLSSAALSLLARHDPTKSLDTALARLVGRLLSAARLDDALLASAVEVADLALLAHALACRSGITPRTAFDELMSCDPRRVMMILRLANVPKQLAAQLLAAVGDLIGLGLDAQNLDAFDAVSAEAQSAARDWLQLDPSFQSALRELGHGNGQRSF